ncbi:MAG: hypothetical protein HYZ90_03845 [Candidatus Omnitrophica bacterium]|nr:hypothetical protein [Candidatus Omnitrophota bacterium]
MNAAQVERFFRLFAQKLDEPATVILTGAAAGALWGNVRPSRDVDFAVWPKRKSPGVWRKIEAAVKWAIQVTGIAANYAEDIDRWGAISLLDYREQSRPYRRFGKVEVRLMDPAYWAIGKLSRYIAPDIRDLVAALKMEEISPARLLKVWGRALRASPPSDGCFQFRRNVESFLKMYGRTIWGKRFDPERTRSRFHREAGIRSSGQAGG